jgi:hypothetical protein
MTNPIEGEQTTKKNSQLKKYQWTKLERNTIKKSIQNNNEIKKTGTKFNMKIN